MPMLLMLYDGLLRKNVISLLPEGESRMHVHAKNFLLL